MSPTNEPAAELDEPVHLSEWNPFWPALAREISSELAQSIGQECPIEHIGSTALEGMPSKPIVDLMIGVGDTHEQEAVARRLSAAGWQDMGEAGVPGRRHLRKRAGAHANVHIILVGSSNWLNNLAIRDYLRAHPRERLAYAVVKQQALSTETGLLKYSDRKADFMTALMERARAWRTRRVDER